MNLRTEVEINLHIAHTAMLRMCTLQSTSHSTTPPSPQHPAIYTDCLVECIVSGQPEPSVKALNSTYLLIGSIVSIFYVFYFLVSGVFYVCTCYVLPSGVIIIIIIIITLHYIAGGPVSSPTADQSSLVRDTDGRQRRARLRTINSRRPTQRE